MSFTPFPSPKTLSLPDYIQSTNINFSLLEEELNRIHNNVIRALNKPQSVSVFRGTFALVLTGVAASPIVEASFTIISNIVTLSIPLLTGLSNATSCTITGMPEVIFPDAKRVFFVSGLASGVIASVRAEIAATGIITITNGLNAAAASWTNDNLAKGIEGSTLSYLL